MPDNLDVQVEAGNVAKKLVAFSLLVIGALFVLFAKKITLPILSAYSSPICFVFGLILVIVGLIIQFMPKTEVDDNEYV